MDMNNNSLFNNIIINRNSNKYNPFLFNLLSGRRRLLTDNEFSLIKNMFKKSNCKLFTSKEHQLYIQLINEKQFIDDSEKLKIESELCNLICANIHHNKIANDFSFGIEITRDCNMSCPHCYAQSWKEHSFLTNKHIDAIYDFYVNYGRDLNKINNIKTIGITGGESLLNDHTINIINYISKKWENSKLTILTNGINIIKYKNYLPWLKIGSICISLDGIEQTHLNRRYSNKRKIDKNIYEVIIGGIKYALRKNINVIIKVVLDKSTYLEYEEFKKYLYQENILSSDLVQLNVSATHDYNHPLELDKDYNTTHDVLMMQKHISNIDGFPSNLFPNTFALLNILSRPFNEPYIPLHQACSTDFLKNCFFSCDGNVYFCGCTKPNHNTIGTYFPNASINKDNLFKLQNRSILNSSQCIKCVYKHVCLGGCPMTSVNKETNMTCGIFAEPNLIDNIEFDYFSIPGIEV